MLEHPKIGKCRRKKEILAQARTEALLVGMGLWDP